MRCLIFKMFPPQITHDTSDEHNSPGKEKCHSSSEFVMEEVNLNSVENSTLTQNTINSIQDDDSCSKNLSLENKSTTNCILNKNYVKCIQYSDEEPNIELSVCCSPFVNESEEKTKEISIVKVPEVIADVDNNENNSLYEYDSPSTCNIKNVNIKLKEDFIIREKRQNYKSVSSVNDMNKSSCNESEIETNITSVKTNTSLSDCGNSNKDNDLESVIMNDVENCIDENKNYDDSTLTQKVTVMKDIEKIHVFTSIGTNIDIKSDSEMNSDNNLTSSETNISFEREYEVKRCNEISIKGSSSTYIEDIKKKSADTVSDDNFLSNNKSNESCTDKTKNSEIVSVKSILNSGISPFALKKQALLVINKAISKSRLDIASESFFTDVKQDKAPNYKLMYSPNSADEVRSAEANKEISDEVDDYPIQTSRECLELIDLFKEEMKEISNEYDYPVLSTRECPELFDLFTMMPQACIKVERTEMYSCKRCSSVFSSLEGLEKHSRKHIGNAVVLLKPLPDFHHCDKCTSVFTKKYQLQAHLIEHLKNKVRAEKKLEKEIQSEVSGFIKKFKCNECDAMFVLESTLKRHMFVHDPKPHVCHCGIAFYERKDMKVHEVYVHVTTRKCGMERPKPFEPKINYTGKKEKKFRKELSEEEVDPYSDDDSQDEDFSVGESKKSKRKRTSNVKQTKDSVKRVKKEKSETEIEALNKMIMHGDRFGCSVCHTTLKSKISYLLHYRIHTGEKPHKCETCGKTFTQQAALNTHVNSVHKNLRPYKCEQCGKRLLSKNALQTHTFTHTDERPYICPYCNKGFNDPSALVRHKRIHTGEKRYVCKICDKGFTDVSALRAHSLRHAAPNYKCDYCPKIFHTPEACRNHQRLRHVDGRKYFQCDICTKKFQLKQYLVRHIKWVHLKKNKKKKY